MKLMTGNTMMITLTHSFELEQTTGLEANFRDVNQFGITDLQCIKKLKSIKNLLKIIQIQHTGDLSF